MYVRVKLYKQLLQAEEAKAYRSIEKSRSALKKKDEEIERIGRQLREERSRSVNIRIVIFYSFKIHSIMHNPVHVMK